MKNKDFRELVQKSDYIKTNNLQQQETANQQTLGRGKYLISRAA